MIEKITDFICLISTCNENCPFYDGPFTFGCSSYKIMGQSYSEALNYAIKCVQNKENRCRLKYVLEKCPEKIPEPIYKYCKMEVE